MLAQKGGVDDIARLEERGYTFDLKVDGVRCLVEVDQGVVRLTSRSGVDMTTRYPEITEALTKAHPGISVVLDGEIAVDDEHGLPSWPLTHKRDAQQSRAHWWARQMPATFYAFDVLEVSVRDMRRWEFESRREVLVDLARRSWDTDRLRVVLHSTAGQALWTVVNTHKLEGLVAKNPRAPYREGKRSADWLKIKRTETYSCLVGGYDPGEGSRASTFGALHLYMLDADNKPVPVGKVGTGFSNAELRSIRAQLDLNTTLIVEVSCLDVSPDNKLRQPVFEHVRGDIAVIDCTLDQLHSSH
jgi:bifunctional non-homologous end joining protein LigD